MHQQPYCIFNGVVVEVEHDLPIVGVIRQINVVNEDEVVFTTDEYHISFEPHYHAYVLDKIPFSSGIVLHIN